MAVVHRDAVRRRTGLLLLFASAFFMTTIAAALANPISGGCTGSVNGRPIEQLTQDDPVAVEKGGALALNGSAPPAIASLPRRGVTSTTTIKLWVVDGIFGITRHYPARGGRWGGDAQVPSWVSSVAPGVYRVDGNVGGTPGQWRCSGTAWIEIEGGAATAAAGAGLVLTAGGVAATMSGKGKKVTRPDDARVGKTLVNLVREIHRVAGPEFGADAVWLIALVLIYLLVFGSPVAFLLPFMAAGGDRGGRRTLWVRGRPVRGVIGGVLFGLGLALLGHQFLGEILSLRTVVFFPIVAAVLSGLRAWMGRSYAVETEAEASA